MVIQSSKSSSMTRPLDVVKCFFSPIVMVHQILLVDWCCPGQFEFMLHVVGHSSTWEVQLASTSGQDRDPRMIKVWVILQPQFCEAVGINIQLCLQRELLIWLVVVLVTFDVVHAGNGCLRFKLLERVSDFSNDIPLR